MTFEDRQRHGREMTLEEKCLVSHRADAMKKFARWYLSRDRR